MLRSPHAYLGVVGSRSKIAFVNKTLMDRGIPEEALKAVHTPIGTPIRAVTPAEIAVSILGRLISAAPRSARGEMRTTAADARISSIYPINSLCT